MNERQKEILDRLLDHREGLSLDDLVERLGITKTAVRGHIDKLITLGYVRHADSRGSVGRPKRRYHLTEEGDEVFPRRYAWLSNELLAMLAEQMGPEAVGGLMSDLAERVSASLGPSGPAKRPVTRLKEVVDVLNDLGYRARIRQSDVRKGPVVEAVNCVYHSVAQRHPKLCSFDVRFLEQSSGMNVRLEKCIARGDSVCRFCFSAGRKRNPG